MTNIDLAQTLKQSQQLLLSLSMQKALFVLQLPILELREWLEEELSLNPVLERKESEFAHESNTCFEEERNTDCYRAQEEYYTPEDAVTEPLEQSSSLFTHLMTQAKLVFSTKEELWIAEQLIGNLDEKGFLNTLPENVCFFFSKAKIEEVVSEIQQMDPIGICVKSPQESLLLQLEALGKKDSLIYWIIENHYEELLQQRFSFLEKKSHIPAEELQTLLKKELMFLDPYPGLRFQSSCNQTIVPDVIVEKETHKWKIHINDGPLPRFEVTKEYESVYGDLSPSDKKYFAKHYSSAKWIVKAVKKRNETILSIVKCILKKQSQFFDSDKNELTPLSMAEIAEELSLNESTIARAVSNKYIACPQGVLPLKSFFCSSLSKEASHISNYNAKQILQKIILEENKSRPLSDTALVKKMQRMGFTCARRTVTKYRKALNIAPASKRKLK